MTRIPRFTHGLLSFRAVLNFQKILTLLSLTLGTIGTTQAMAAFKVGIVLDKGGKDDKSFNASAYKGVMDAKDKLKVFVKYVEAADDNSFEPQIKAFVKKDFDLIIGVGFAQVDAIKKVAAEYPNKHFVIIDGEVKLPNVRSILFADHEGSFLVGAIAALKSETNKVGYIGGMDVPMIRRFEMAYIAGAKHVKPKINVTSNFVGVTIDAWNNPPRAKELALTQYAGGADVIFAAAGASGTGVFDAAEEKKKFIIGVDSNQNWIKPGLVLTSMLKRIDVAVLSTCEDALKDIKSIGGTKIYSLSNNGVDYALDQYNDKLMTPAIRKQADAIKTGIISGKIKVPDYYETPNKK